jgi:hypothetical protein
MATLRCLLATEPGNNRAAGRTQSTGSLPWYDTSTPGCDDAGMAALTLEEIAAKIATAEIGFAAATSPYDRNVFAQIRDEYRRYAEQRAKEIAKHASAAASSTS